MVLTVQMNLSTYVTMPQLQLPASFVKRTWEREKEEEEVHISRSTFGLQKSVSVVNLDLIRSIRVSMCTKRSNIVKLIKLRSLVYNPTQLALFMYTRYFFLPRCIGFVDDVSGEGLRCASSQSSPPITMVQAPLCYGQTRLMQ